MVVAHSLCSDWWPPGRSFYYFPFGQTPVSEAGLVITLQTTKPRGLLGPSLQKAAAKLERALRVWPRGPLPPARDTGQRNGGARPREGSPGATDTWGFGSQRLPLGARRLRLRAVAAMITCPAGGGGTAAPAGRACPMAWFECPVARDTRKLRTPQRARRAGKGCEGPCTRRHLYQVASGPFQA